MTSAVQLLPEQLKFGVDGYEHCDAGVEEPREGMTSSSKGGALLLAVLGGARLMRPLPGVRQPDERRLDAGSGRLCSVGLGIARGGRQEPARSCRRPADRGEAGPEIAGAVASARRWCFSSARPTCTELVVPALFCKGRWVKSKGASCQGRSGAPAENSWEELVSLHGAPLFPAVSLLSCDV
mmetsp:Transcript_37134/g.88285  ORF Transcript_37134/g.88285 Transcript_37134/m.88285 type:complete len:182 (+) Transcript_37134:364-909(+)